MGAIADGLQSPSRLVKVKQSLPDRRYNRHKSALLAVFLMKNIPRWLLILSVGLLVALALVWLKPRPAPRPAPAPALEKVAVALVQPQTLALSVRAQGSLSPRREIDLVAEVAGRVVQVADHFVSGAAFRAGETLVQLDDANYRFARVRAQSRVAEATQLLAAEKGRVRQAQREWRDLGDAEANALFLRKPQLAAAEAALASARADLAQAELDLARTRISAPFDGRIRETRVNLGQYVSPAAAIARVYDSQVVELKLALTDAQAALLDLPLGFQAEPGQGPAVTITGTVAGQTRQWLGHIRRTAASLDTKTRMYSAVAEIHQADYPDSPLIIGLFVQAEIAGRPLPQVVQLPRSALINADQLMLLDADNRVRLERVQVLARDSEFVWLRGDLQAGQRAVLARQGYLLPGEQVEPQL